MSWFRHPRNVWAWALYDWANSAFVTTVLAGFFPIFFKSYWAKDLASGESTYQLGLANTLASLAVLLVAPFVAVWGDRLVSRNLLTFAFALLGSLSGVALFFLPAGDWQVAQLVFMIMLIAFSLSLIFYDALLLDVALSPKRGAVSALGYALGYLGGGLLFALNVAWVSFPEFFGFSSSAQAVRVSFLSAAIWWLLFSLPLLSLPKSVLNRQAKRWEIKLLWQHKNIFWFLIAYWFYIDGVDTVIRMAVDYGLALGFSQNHLIGALLITQFVGLPATLAYGWLTSRLGYRRALFIGLSIYIGITLWATQMTDVREFYAMALAVGLVQGGVQASSRAYFAALIPTENATAFFGLYNMFGKIAAILGPVMMGLIARTTGEPRLSVMAIIALLVVGMLLLGIKQRDYHGRADGAGHHR